MIHVIYVKNPFNVSSREVKSFPYNPEKEVQHYIKEFALFNLNEISIGMNGKKLEEDQYNDTLEDEDYIIICPKMEKGGFLTFLAFIALAVVSAGVGNLASGGTFWAAGAGHAMTAQLIATAMFTIGGNLMGLFTPTTNTSIQSSSPTYGWDKGGNSVQQGNAVPMTYGKLLVTGQLLAQHVEISGDSQYLNILLSGGEGSIDSISDIRVEDNPIDNYENVTYTTRLGTNDQTLIPNFGTTYADQTLNYDLREPQPRTVSVLHEGYDYEGTYFSYYQDETVYDEAVWNTQQTEGDGGSGLEITIELPYGLYHTNNDGNLENAQVTIEAQYRVVGASDWIYLVSGAGIVAGQSQAVRRTYRADNIGVARYEVRVRCTYKSGTSTRYGTRVYWTGLSHITYDDFCYPNTVLLGLRILATDQLSGSQPKVTWVQERKNVLVYNPYSFIYELKPANNPAWASYDLIHRCRRLININTGNYEYDVRGVPTSRILYDEFLTWANACIAKNLKINIILDVADDLWSHSLRIGEIGRGHIIMRGTKFGCFYDAPNMQPIQIFNIANIYVDTFSEDFLAITDKANALEVTFYNELNNFEAETVICYGKDYDDSKVINNPATKTLYGCTNRDQAIKDGKYRLLLTENLVRTLTIDADVDSIACQVNDVVAIQHDVPQWGIGGRLVSYVSGTVVLDKPVTITPGKYYTLLASAIANNRENLQFVAVTNDYLVETTTDTIRVVPFEFPPIKNCLFTFGETGKEKKLFKVISITRSSDIKRNIQCIEYISEVYDESGYIPPNISYAQPPQPYPVNSDILVRPNYYIQSDGTVANEIAISWTIVRGANPNAFLVETSMDAGMSWYSQGRFYGKNASIRANRMGDYIIRVTAIYNATASTPVISDPITLSGKDFPPSNIQAINLLQNQDYSNIIEVSWNGVLDADLAGYKIKYGDVNSTWDTATFAEGRSDLIINDIKYSLTLADSGTYQILCRPIDTSGNLSIGIATSTITIDCYPDDVSGFDALQCL